MKRIILIVLSFVPLIMGQFYNAVATNTVLTTTGITLLSLSFLVLWFLVGVTSIKLTHSLKESIIYSHAIGLVFLLLGFIQTAVLKEFIAGGIGYMTQLYFLPVVRIGSLVESKILFFASTHYMFPITFVSFALMIFMYTLGYKVAENRRQVRA